VHYRRIAASVLLTLILAWSAPLARAQAASPSPTSFHLLEASIDDIHQAFKSKRIRCHALVELYFKRIQAYDKVGPSLNAIQSINAGALSEADRLDAAFRSSGLVGALHCIPVLVKDQVETNDMPTTYGSVLFKDFIPQRNATIITNLKNAGAVILGKTTMGEFASGYLGSGLSVMHTINDVMRVVPPAELVRRLQQILQPSALAKIQADPSGALQRSTVWLGSDRPYRW
jgi:hypothetical protein